MVSLRPSTSSLLKNAGIGRCFHVMVLSILVGVVAGAVTAGAPPAAGDSRIDPDVWSTRDIKQRINQGTPLTTAEGQAKLAAAGLASRSVHTAQVAIYYDEVPNDAERQRLAGLGVNVAGRLWIPPVPGKHPHGYILAEVPYGQLNAAAAGPAVRRVASVERALYPHNDLGGARIRADVVRTALPTTYDGTGVSIAVLDSSLDVDHPDIPTPVEAYDVTDGDGIGSWGTDVSATVTDHGTHVTGTALGRGTASMGVYTGIAPGADLYFYKIGNDVNGTASWEDMIEAFGRVMEVHADVATMSYGGWSTYQDGSSATCQVIDATVTAGTVVFVSAGNARNDAQHDSALFSGAGTIESGLNIRIDNTYGSVAFTDDVFINILRVDRIFDDDNLWLSIANLDPDEALTREWYGTSPRGTESTSYRLTPSVAAGAAKTYAVSLTNTGDYPMTAHLYLFAGSDVSFTAADETFTIEAPALADDAIAVGAWVSRDYWIDWLGDSWTWYEDLDTLASFSSLGPRVDGQLKPDLCAPGSAVISCRDFDLPAPEDWYLIDSDGSNDGTGPTDYTVKQGTSMACPMAAGAAALLLHAHPALSPAQVRNILTQTASEGPTPDDRVGHGLIDILRAIDTDCNGNGIPDLQDIELGLSRDANSNGMPDECEGSDRPGYRGTLIVSVGDPVPGAEGEFTDLNTLPVINNGKAVAFWADSDFHEGIFYWADGTLSALAKQPDPAPGTGGYFAQFDKDISINSAGAVGFHAHMSSAEVSAGLFVATQDEVSLVAWGGQELPEIPATIAGLTTGPKVADDGDVYFRAFLRDAPGDLGGNGAILKVSDGVVSVIAATGMTVPGIGTLNAIGDGPWIDGGQWVVFFGSVEGPELVIRTNGEVFELVAAVNDRAPGTDSRFFSFDENVSLPGPIETYYRATYDVGLRVYGLFKTRITGEREALILEGMTAPVLADTFLHPGRARGNPLGDVFFHSQLTSGNPTAGIFRLNQRTGRIHTLLTTGEIAPGVAGQWIDDVSNFDVNDIGDWVLCFKTTDDRRHLIFFDQDLLGDLDEDDDVDSVDYALFWECLEGPLETRPPECARADLDGDGEVDLEDYQLMQDAYVECAEGSPDCNGNGVPDFCELEGSIATDCDENGVLDECDVILDGVPDCNNNFYPDVCDIADGASVDLDEDGVPDECQGFSDCNLNGIGDVFDIEAGTSLDCNGNGVPDDCELFGGSLRLITYAGEPDTSLLELDPETARVVRPLGTGYDRIKGLASSRDGRVWGVGPLGAVMSIDPLTWEQMTIARPGSPGFSGVAFDSRAQTLYGTAGGDLYRISTEHGSAEIIGPILRSIQGLTFDSERSVLYGIMTGGSVWAIDPETAWDTPLCSPTGLNNIKALCYDDDLLYVISEGGTLYTIDPMTCETTTVGYAGFGVSEVDGLVCLHHSTDCNGNEVPDECDIAEGVAEDCNSNGVPDACDLADGTMDDCNSNGLPDECEDLGDSDCNGDRIIDACQGDAPGLIWTHLYGAIYRAGLDGEEVGSIPGVLVNQPTGVAVDPLNRKMYWADRRLYTIRRANLDGTGAETIVSRPETNMNDMAIDPAADSLFWCQTSDGELMRSRLDGSVAIPIASDLDCPDSVAVDRFERKVYYTDGSGTAHRLWRANYDGTEAEVIVHSETYLHGLAIDAGGGHVYWGDPDAGRIRRAALDGTEPADFVTGTDSVKDLALDVTRNRLYWLNDDTDMVQMADLDGSVVFDVVSTVGSTPYAIDVVRTILGDCNENDILDACDILDDPDADVDGDGLLDACIGVSAFHDCNENGIPDVEDIASGTSQDCNGNGVPDECDIEDGTSEDCNRNAIPDACDIADGTAPDTDGDGIPDECRLDCNRNGFADSADIATGTSLDCNDDGLPDECQFADAWLYWTDSAADTIERCRLDGSDRHVVAYTPVPQGVDLDPFGRRMFWLSGDGAIHRGDLSGIDAETLLSDLPWEPLGTALDFVNQRVLWCLRSSSDGRLCRVNFDGTGYATFFDYIFEPKDVAVDPVHQHAYWINQVGVYRANLDGSGPERVLEVPLSPAVYDVAVEPEQGWVYWSFHSRPYPGSIHRCRLDGTDAEMLMSFPDSEHQLAIAVDSTDARLYWFDRSTRLIRRANLDASDPEDFLELSTESVTRLAVLHGTGTGYDCNRNGVLDECDIRDGTSEDADEDGVPDECYSDCNDNGIDDMRDILDGTSEDCNINWVPDECEPDCNENGVADECDIRDEVSQDCQPDGVPDECQIDGNDCNENGIPDDCEPDCNENGVPDDCDIAGGASEDCNANGTPDECDIADGTSRDADGNGVPDECEMYIVYVDVDADGAEDGTSWTDAFHRLEDALALAMNPAYSSISEIWVAAGTYVPDGGTGDRTACFQLVNNVSLYGGFAGGEASLEDRDLGVNATVLSGDIGVPGDSADNTHCILVADSTIQDARLDGFVITNARADDSDPYDRGGGVRNIGGTLTLANCRFIENHAFTGSGFMNFDGATATVVNCLFRQNVADLWRGGAINNTGSTLVLTNTTIVDNAAAGANAGGVLNNNEATITMTNCILWGNTAADGTVEDQQFKSQPPESASVSYCCIEGLDIYTGTGSFDLDPWFVSGPFGDHYLSQVAAGQADDSPCVDAGDPASELVGGTTRTDSAPDEAPVDMGYHY